MGILESVGCGLGQACAWQVGCPCVQRRGGSWGGMGPAGRRLWIPLWFRGVLTDSRSSGIRERKKVGRQAGCGVSGMRRWPTRPHPQSAWDVAVHAAPGSPRRSNRCGGNPPQPTRRDRGPRRCRQRADDCGDGHWPSSLLKAVCSQQRAVGSCQVSLFAYARLGVRLEQWLLGWAARPVSRGMASTALGLTRDGRGIGHRAGQCPCCEVSRKARRVRFLRRLGNTEHSNCESGTSNYAWLKAYG